MQSIRASARASKSRVLGKLWKVLATAERHRGNCGPCITNTLRALSPLEPALVSLADSPEQSHAAAPAVHCGTPPATTPAALRAQTPPSEAPSPPSFRAHLG